MYQSVLNMTQVTVSEAARLTGKARATLQRHIKNGTVSVTRDKRGNPLIDPSELIRVYGEFKIDSMSNGTAIVPDTSHDKTVTIALLQEELRVARERELWLKQQLEREQERSKELELKMLPVVAPKKGLLSRIFGK